MIELSLAATAAIAVVLLAVGLVAGYVLCYARQQRDGGGRTAAELREELDGYRDRVGAHFERSAVLFHELTGRYRELYEHLAEGADSLGGAGRGEQRLGFDELTRIALRAPPAPAGDDFDDATCTLGPEPSATRGGGGEAVAADARDAAAGADGDAELAVTAAGGAGPLAASPPAAPQPEHETESLRGDRATG
ncbi:MAG: DUF1043 family protein [Gammaproteobacteria bacterium]|nr:DUF1043 family protein [Gammaproteobacteria bacterium]